MPTFKITIGSQMTRNYAGQEITFTLSREVEVETTRDIDAEYNKLLNILDRQHELFIAEKLPELRSMPDFKSPDVLMNKYTVDKFVLTVDRGKRLIKAITKEAKYSQWGVACYEEVAEQYALDAIMGASTEVEVDNVTVIVDESGKYKKVIKIEGLG